MEQFGGQLVGFHYFVGGKAGNRGDSLIDSSLVQPRCPVSGINSHQTLTKQRLHDDLGEGFAMSDGRGVKGALDVIPALVLQLFNKWELNFRVLRTGHYCSFLYIPSLKFFALFRVCA